MNHWKNPILEGFYPDPSICRVEDRYYLVNSTFAFYPGIPLFVSKDLQNWEQIGNVLNRPSQLQLEGCAHSQGIYAPTIRYFNGKYYLVTTNVGSCENFLVTADQPEGPWSDPYLLDAQGIDPSLFFEEDGTCYYVGTRERTGGGSYFGDNEIWIQKLNLSSMKLEGESVPIWYGFMEHSVWPEGPHIYKKDGWYYLIYAEGGTEQHHCVAAARSRTLTGPYEGCPDNPIFTHRHLGKHFPVTCTGHGDLVEDGQGNWYMVLLACRPREGYTLKGRETFLADVSWENDWPVILPGKGYLEADGKASDFYKEYRFRENQWDLGLLRLRGPVNIQMLDGCMRLPMEEGTLEQRKETSFVALRQKWDDFFIEATLLLSNRMKEGECSGLAYLQNEENQIRLEICEKEDNRRAQICVRRSGVTECVYEMTIPPENRVHLRMKVKKLKAVFEIEENRNWKQMGETLDVRHLSTELAGGFTGCVAGVYASSNGTESDGFADVIQLQYGTLIQEKEKAT